MTARRYAIGKAQVLTCVLLGTCLPTLGEWTGLDVAFGTSDSVCVDTRTDETHLVSAGSVQELYGEEPWTAPNEAGEYALTHTDEDGEWTARYRVPGPGIEVVGDLDITSDTMWESNKTWIVCGTVLVRGGTLTIEPGTRVVFIPGGYVRNAGGTVVSTGATLESEDLVWDFDMEEGYAESDSDETKVDTMDIDGLRFAADRETISYSSAWGGGQAPSVQVSVEKVEGGSRVVLDENAPANGEFEWTVEGPGYYVWTHTAGGEESSARFVSIDAEQTMVVRNLVVDEGCEWGKAKIILVVDTVTVKSGATLTITPGAVVKFMDGAGIVCEAGGMCEAEGVTFTHAKDDTVGGDTLMDGASAPVYGMYVLNGVRGDDSTQYRYHPDPTVTLSGTIAQNEIWRGFNVYCVTGNVTIASGATLTIDPGAVIKFAEGKSLTVNSGATLNAIGTRAQPIVFTSIKDDEHGGDTNGDGDKSLPQPGDWVKIGINGGTASFEYSHVLYSSKNSTTGAINMNGGTVVFNNGEIAHGMYDAVGVESGNFHMSNSVIRDCLLAFRHWARDPIVNCVIYDCGRLTQGGGQHFYNCVFARISETWEAFGFPQNGTTYSNCCFWNESGSVLTGEGTQDAMTVCGKNGNIWANPRFIDPDKGDFRVDEKSPCVDLADAAHAPEKDYFGQPRVNAPDIGICEVMPRNATSDIDLVPQSVTADAEAISGQLLTIRWTVLACLGKWTCGDARRQGDC